MKKAMVLLVSACSIAMAIIVGAPATPAHAASAAWDGTTVDTSWYFGHETDSTYTLSNAEQLAGLANLVNTGHPFTGKTIELGDSIDLGNKQWITIGSYGNPFSGVFDGKNNTVSNLRYQSSTPLSGAYSYTGLFGYVSGNTADLPQYAEILPNASNFDYAFGTAGIPTDARFSAVVKNLTLSNASIDFGTLGSSTYLPTGKYVGGVVGCAENAYLSNVRVQSSSIRGTCYVGGIVGIGVNAWLSNCSTDALTEVKFASCLDDGTGIPIQVSYAESLNNGTYHFGGIAGAFITGDKNGFVALSGANNCSNAATVTSAALNNNSGTAGGFAGLVRSNSRAIFYQCSNAGSVTAYEYLGADLVLHAGGIVGTGNAASTSSGGTTIIDCQNTGHVAFLNGSPATGSYYAGGIVGTMLLGSGQAYGRNAIVRSSSTDLASSTSKAGGEFSGNGGLFSDIAFDTPLDAVSGELGTIVLNNVSFTPRTIDYDIDHPLSLTLYNTTIGDGKGSSRAAFYLANGSQMGDATTTANIVFGSSAWHNQGTAGSLSAGTTLTAYNGHLGIVGSLTSEAGDLSIPYNSGRIGTVSSTGAGNVSVRNVLDNLGFAGAIATVKNEGGGTLTIARNNGTIDTVTSDSDIVIAENGKTLNTVNATAGANVNIQQNTGTIGAVSSDGTGTITVGASADATMGNFGTIENIGGTGTGDVALYANTGTIEAVNRPNGSLASNTSDNFNTGSLNSLTYSSNASIALPNGGTIGTINNLDANGGTLSITSQNPSSTIARFTGNGTLSLDNTTASTLFTESIEAGALSVAVANGLAGAPGATVRAATYLASAGTSAGSNFYENQTSALAAVGGQTYVWRTTLGPAANSSGWLNSTYAPTITSSDATGCTISPLGTTTVAYGGSQTFEITLQDGYKINDLLVDGASVGAVGHYTFNSVFENHTIHASAVSTVDTLESIEITTPPTKTSYVEGQLFDPAGMEVVAHYNNLASDGPITGYTWTPKEGLNMGTSAVQVSYTEGSVTKTASVDINVAPRQVTGISAKTAPTKLNYVAGQQLNLAGLAVALSYNDGTSVDVPFTNFATFGITASPANGTPLAMSNNGSPITVSLDAQTASVGPLSVSPKAITSISIADNLSDLNQGRVQYYVASEALSINDIAVDLAYNDGTHENGVPYYLFASRGLTASVNGKENGTALSVNDNGAALIVTDGAVSSTNGNAITVVATTSAESLTLLGTQPTPLSMAFLPGKTVFNLPVNSLSAAYSINGVAKSLVISPDRFSTFGVTTNLPAAGAPLTASYNGQPLTYRCGAAETSTSETFGMPEKLSLNNQPAKLSYYVGQPLNLSGLSVKVEFSNSVTENASSLILGEFGITASPANDASLTLADNGAPITFTMADPALTCQSDVLSVAQDVPMKLEITALPTKLTYVEGESFSPDGINVTATMQSGATQQVTGLVTYSPQGPLSTANNQITVSYAENGETVTATVPITVTPTPGPGPNPNPGPGPSPDPGPGPSPEPQPLPNGTAATAQTGDNPWLPITATCVALASACAVAVAIVAGRKKRQR